VRSSARPNHRIDKFLLVSEGIYLGIISGYASFLPTGNLKRQRSGYHDKRCDYDRQGVTLLY
jgi:hypothetical protein